MALPVARFIIQGDDQSGKAFKSATENSVKFGEGAAKGALKAIAGFAGVALSIEGVAKILQKSIQAYSQAEATEIRFGVAARNNPQISGTAVKNLQTYIAQQVRSTVLSREQVASTVTSLVQQGRSEQQIKAITTAAIGLAAATGEDLKSASEQVATTYSGQARELGKLYPVIRNMTDQDLRAGKAAEYLAQANAGVAQAMAGSVGGKIQQMKNAAQETLMAVGGALAPIITKALDAIRPMIEKVSAWISENSTRIGNFFMHIPQLAKLAFDMLLDIVVAYITQIPTIVKNVAIALFHFWLDNWKLTIQLMWDIAKLVFAILWKPLRLAFEEAVFWIQKGWHELVSLLASLGNATIIPVFNAILSAIQSVTNGILDVVDHVRAAAQVAAAALKDPLHAGQELAKYGETLAKMQKERGAGVQIQPMQQFKVAPFTGQAPNVRTEMAGWQEGIKGALGKTFKDAWEGIQKEFADVVALAVAAGQPIADVFAQYAPKFMKILNDGLDVAKTGLAADQGKQIYPNSPYSKIQQNLLALGSNLKSEFFAIEATHTDINNPSKVTGFQLVAPTMDPMTMILTTLSTFASSISAITLLLNPLQTILSAVFKVITPLVNQILAPLVGFLTIMGNTIGKILVPILQLLAPILEFVSIGLVFLYNYAILPLANAIIFVCNLIYDILATIWNAIASVINALLGWLGVHLNYMGTKSLTSGFLTPITVASMTATGQAAEAGAGGTGAQAQYTGQQAIIVNIQNNFGTASIVGIPNFVAEIMRDIQAVNATNQGTG